MRPRVLLPLIVAALLALYLALRFGVEQAHEPKALRDHDGELVQEVDKKRGPLDGNLDSRIAGAPDPRSGESPERHKIGPPALEPVDKPQLVVFGRVLDEGGASLADARVRIAAHQIWAEGIDLPRLEGRYDLRGFEVRTDATGAFRIEAPPPTTRRTTLTIEAGPFHDSYSLRFGGTRVGDRPSLGADQLDLGEIRLASTGAISGRVTDTQGKPLTDVHMTIGAEKGLTFGRNAWTNASGRYILDHSPVGTYGIEARLEGFINGFRSPILVQARIETSGVDFVLETAESIEGVVVDESGRPLEGAELWGWPTTSGSGAGARSGPDGNFTVHLPQTEPYTLEAKLDGYRTWGNQDGPETHAPGTRGLRIVMAPMPRTRFTIVDAETAEPIEQFGFEILLDNGSKHLRGGTGLEAWRPRSEEHPGGVVEATARQGFDAYLVAAEGFVLARGDVEHDVPGIPAQTVRLRRGTSLLGRVTKEGRPMRGSRVWVERVSAHPIESADGKKTRVFRLEGSNRLEVRTRKDGRFRVQGLEQGAYRLTVQPMDDSFLVLTPIHVDGKRQMKLGNLELVQGATIAGRVLTPEGVEPGGLTVHLGDRREGVMAITDPEGRFLFERIPPGLHAIEVEDRQGELAAPDAVAYELAAGEILEVSIDARDGAVCQVSLLVDLGNLPVQGAQVTLIDQEDPTQCFILGNCDSEGRLSNAVRAWGPAKIQVFFPGGGWAMHPSLSLDLRPFEKIEQDVRFEFSRLSIRLPQGVPLPDKGRVFLELQPLDDPTLGSQRISIGFAGGRPRPHEWPDTRLTEGALHVGAVLAGSWRIRLSMEQASDKARLIELPDGGIRVEKPSYFETIRDVTLEPGAEFVLDLD